MARPAQDYAYIGFRAPAELKRKLEISAARAGRSLSTEVQFRLEQSLNSQTLLIEAISLILADIQPAISITQYAVMQRLEEAHARARTAPL